MLLQPTAWDIPTKTSSGSIRQNDSPSSVQRSLNLAIVLVLLMSAIATAVMGRMGLSLKLPSQGKFEGAVLLLHEFLVDFRWRGWTIAFFESAEFVG
jgi:hypothetical protein